MTSDEDPIVITDRWDFEYRYFAGEVTSRFLRSLRDERRIMATRCPSCKRTLTPARSFCDRCYVKTDDWIEVGPSGYVETFTIITAQLPGMPEPPIVIAYVTLDGSDTALLNEIRGLNLDSIDDAAATLLLRPRVTAVFEPKGQAKITDFYYSIES